VKKKKKDKKKQKKEVEKSDSKSRDNSGDSSELSDAEIDLESSILFTSGKNNKPKKGTATESNSRSASPPAPPEKSRPEKRKADDQSVGQQIAKKLKPEAQEKPQAPSHNLPASVLQAAQ
jgi:hypothetical protein